MAFLKYAKATVVSPHVSAKGWGKIRTAATDQSVSSSVSSKAEEILGGAFDPSKYLLSHATIVCSVDVEDVQGVKVGSVQEDGTKITRSYTDYRINPDCDKFINNNLDAWSRDVLMKSYRTFVGAHNFVEHVQIENLSKGRIIDAVARDIGDSVYIDILVATDRKHTDLVKAIEGGKMATMSMGCSVDFTVCTKCGNVAADETEMCNHIKYQKGNTFFDESGRQHRIAELCGHHTLDPTGGVTFIEASWVATPAFAGAVMRNILAPTEMSPSAVKKAQEVLSSPPKEWVEDDRLAKAASFGDLAADWGDEDEGEDSSDDAGASPIKELEDKIVAKILEKARQRIEDDLSGEPSSISDSTMEPNDTLQREASWKDSYLIGLEAICKTASHPADLLNRVALYNKENDVLLPLSLYRASLKIGSTNKYSSLVGYLSACASALGRKPSLIEAKALIRLGKLLSHTD